VTPVIFPRRLRRLLSNLPKSLELVFYIRGSRKVSAKWGLQAFRDGLRELGYVEGKNLQLEIRCGEGKLERMPSLAAELVQSKVDVIVAATSPSVVAARQATRTIPIVMPTSSDPVGDGLVASLAHPGGNITGLSVMSPELGEKRIQLLKEMFPKVSHPVAVLWNPDYVGMRARFEQARGAAPAVGLTVRSVEVRDTRELDAAFEAITREHPEALLLLVDPFTFSQRSRIVEFAAEQRLPAMYETSDFVDPAASRQGDRISFLRGLLREGGRPPLHVAFHAHRSPQFFNAMHH
jgi:putative tryptophan/tyrosine transport system substrate-binding protein